MSQEDLKGLKYYIIYAVMIVGFFTYSGWVGWKWFNPTKTEHTRSTTTPRGAYHLNRHYHK